MAAMRRVCVPKRKFGAALIVSEVPRLQQRRTTTGPGYIHWKKVWLYATTASQNWPILDH